MWRPDAELGPFGCFPPPPPPSRIPPSLSFSFSHSLSFSLSPPMCACVCCIHVSGQICKQSHVFSCSASWYLATGSATILGGNSPFCLAGWPVSSWHLPVSDPQCWGYRHVQPCLTLFMGTENLNSGPRVWNQCFCHGDVDLTTSFLR